MKRALSAFMFVLLLASTLAFSFNLQSVKASGTIYIRADGSIDPTSAPISTVDSVTYTLTGNILSDSDGIVVERSNIIVDGNGYTLQGTGSQDSKGICATGRANVTIRNMEIKAFGHGIYLDSSSNSVISTNNITSNTYSGIWLHYSSYSSITANDITNNLIGIWVRSSSNNIISTNNITASNYFGICLIYSSDYNSITGNDIVATSVDGIRVDVSSNNIIFRNNVTNNGGDGIELDSSSYNNTIVRNNITENMHFGITLSRSSSCNNISENNIAYNDCGIRLLDSSDNNAIFHNNFVSNMNQTNLLGSYNNVWDDGYPSGGNYWSDYTGGDGNGDGMGDTPYIIDAYNRDRCPLVKPWNPTSPPVGNCFVPYKIKVKFAVNDVREMVLDEYLKGVVAAEMSSGWPIEALKAQAVAARTVAVRTTQHNHVKEDVCTDPAHCQAWKPPPYNQDIEDAVSQTHNEVITYYGWILKNAMFFAWCNGHTLDSEDKPGLNSKPYLRGVSCSGQKCMQYRAMYNPETCPYLTYGNDVSKCDCRLFDEHDPGAGGYYGHRVGMCQEGAKTMAQNGYGYVDIIKHYYTDVDVVTAVTAERRIIAKPQSPVELSISDSQNRVTGLANGSIKSEIPNSEYDEESELVTLFVSNDSYRYTVAGIDLGLYGLIVASATEQGTTVFESDSIPIKANATHQYTIDWDALSRGEEGVTVQVDSDGNGLFEYRFMCDSELTRTEFDFFEQALPWQLGSTKLKWSPVLDFAVHDGTLFAASDSKLGAYYGGNWSLIGAPAYVTSLKAYEDKLIVGGRGGLYYYDGTAFDLIFSVPTYIKVLGVYGNTLYAGTMLDNPPQLYYCNGSANNPANWHVDTDFSDMLSFAGPFGSIDSFVEYDGILYITSGGTVYSFNGTDWNTVSAFDDVYGFLDMQIYDGKLYLATRDQGWRKPLYQGGSGFSGRVIEFDGENWTTVLDHDYWVYSLEVYDNKLYAGTANKILIYDGTDWSTSFNAVEGAYYAISFTVFDDKIYAGMGNGHIFADPAPAKANPETIVVPEFPSATFLAAFMVLAISAAALVRKKRLKRPY